jgi:hypothetical protein
VVYRWLTGGRDPGEWKIPVGQILNWKGVSRDVNADGSVYYCSYYRNRHAAQGDVYTICKGALNPNP